MITTRTKVKKKVVKDTRIPVPVVSLDVLNSYICRERIRSDRIGGNFSIVAIQYASSSEIIIREILPMMTYIIRSVDHIAWDENDRISILLPDTDYAGALAFVEKTKRLSEKNRNNEKSSIYTYPDHWLSNSDEFGECDDEFLESSVKTSIENLFVEKTPIWKRAMDISGSILLLLLLSPLLIFVAVFIKTVAPGPAIFSQDRIGLKGIPFKFYKFRSMKCGNNQNVHGNHSQSFISNGDIPMVKLDVRDPRIIKGGRFLRTSCIDELPQLWNALRGDMSLVGPRPCIPYEAKEYLRWHTHRFDTIPGMTGLWQVSGKNKLTFKQMIRLDIAYCSNITFWKDILILIRTPIAILVIIYDSIRNKIQRSFD